VNTSHRRIKTLSLFSGAGGLDIGFHSQGFDIVGCVEIEGNYCKTLEANKGEGKTFPPDCSIFHGDVRRFDAARFANAGIECIIGGPPCQTFSAAGRRSGGVLGTSDPRGRLFKAYCHILEVIGPKVFVFENVYGLPGANNGGPWREIVDACRSLGYTLAADVLDAADYGVPQHRERLIMVGYKEGEFHFPLPTVGPDSPTGTKLVSVREAIADLQSDSEEDHDNLGGLYGHLLPLIPPGLNYSYFTREMGYPEPIFAWRSKFHDFLYKVDPDQPCRTIKAQPGKFTGPFHWKNRHFTVPELKRLQSFPDEYEIVGSYGKVVEQIGNSVPPLLAGTIATAVREQLIDKEANPSLPVRPVGFVPSFRQRQRERTSHFKMIAAKAIEERFGTNTNSLNTPSRNEVSISYNYYDGFFIKKSFDGPKSETGLLGFKTEVAYRKDHIGLRVCALELPNLPLDVRLEIKGLKEGLMSYSTAELTGTISNLSQMFFLWEMIESVLVENSKFLTLIDIYGHYANRGDTVSVKFEIDEAFNTALTRGLSFFGNSENCGIPIPRRVVENQLGVTAAEFNAVISEMRAMRVDIRTADTHPTISTGMVLCTYPFPLLSEKAHLERRRRADASEIRAEDEMHIAIAGRQQSLFS
jgi:DNA (cytosine-5)-methyltransferase 1